jgi:hypothetical protein
LPNKNGIIHPFPSVRDFITGRDAMRVRKLAQILNYRVFHG